MVKLGICPVQEKRDESIQNIKAEVENIKRKLNYFNGTNTIVQNCGEGLWHRVAYLNMSNSSQQCPSAWREYNSSGIKLCT